MIDQITTEFAGQVGVKPQIIRIMCDDTLAVVTTANYLQSAKTQGYVFSNGDIALITYGTTPTTQFFVLAVTSTTITLTPISSTITLPITSGNLAAFSSTSGGLEDSGSRILSGTTAVFAGGGNSNTFSVPGFTSACVGSAVIRSSTNSVSINKVAPGNDILVVTFSGDPGGNTTVDYIYATASVN